MTYEAPHLTVEGTLEELTLHNTFAFTTDQAVPAGGTIIGAGAASGAGSKP